MSNITYSPHPLLPKKGQQQFPVVQGDTIRDALKKIAVNEEDALCIWVNGKAETNLDRKLAINDSINIKADVRGGDGSNPIAAIAMIALMVTAPALAGIIFSSSAGWATGLVMIGGQFLINSLFPPVTPSLNGLESENVSPTYSLNGSRNRSRIDQPIPIVCGRHKFTPDLGAKPFGTFSGEDQYLYQIFHFGMNPDIDITDLKIGENNIDNYEELQYQFSSGTTGELTLFPSNVDATNGAEVLLSSGDIIRTTSLNTTQFELDFEANLVKYDDRGKRQLMQLEYAVEYREVGTIPWLPVLPAWQRVIQEEQPTATPPIPEVTELTNDGFIENDSRKPKRFSHSLEVPEGQYEVKVTRISPDYEDEEKISAALNWSVLKSYQPDTSDYRGQKRMALKAKASGQFSGSIDQLTATVSAKCPVWDGNNWITTNTSNPAWWLLFFARGRYSADSRLEFGGGLADADIDIEGIKEWAAWCDIKGLEFNFVFDQKMVLSDIFNTIARAGRGSISYHNGSLGVIYDRAEQVTTQAFGMPNIVEDSFQVSYISQELADEIILEFINEDADYTLDEVRVAVPGIAIPKNPVRTRLPGITSVVQAGKEANLIAAEQVFRRRRVTFETDTEGLMCNKGDVIVVGHDLTSWASTGRLDDNGIQSTTQLVLDNEISFDDGAGASYYIGVRHPSGTYEVVSVQYEATPTNTITLLQSLSEDPSLYANNETQDAVWMFGPSDTPGKKLKVIDLQVLGTDLSQVKITATDEDDDYYLTEDGSYVYDTSALFNTGVAEASNLKFYENLDATSGQAVVGFTWDLTDNAIGARVLVKKDEENFVDHGVINGRQFEFTIDQSYDITVKVLAVPIDPSRTSTVTLIDSYTTQGVYLDDALVPVMPDITGLELFNNYNQTEFAGNTAKFNWRVSNLTYDVWETNTFADEGAEGPDFKDYEVTIYNTDGTERRKENIVYNNYEYTIEKNAEDGLGTATRNFTIGVRRRGIQGQLSFNETTLTVNNPAPAIPSAIATDSAINTVFIDCIPPVDLDYEGIMVWSSPTSGFTPTGTEQDTGNCVYKGRVDNIAVNGIASGDTQYFVIAAYDAFGTDEINYSNEFAETTKTVVVNPDSITEIELADNAVTTDKIDALAVNAAKIEANAVTTAKIADNAVTSGEIAANAVTTAKINALAVTAAEIAALTITDTKIASNAITTPKIDTNAVTANEIAAGTITAAEINAGAITASEIAANTITAGQIAAGAITASEVAANTITAGQIAANTITAGQIAAGAITASEVAANTITSNEIAANTITSNEIAANTITAGQIAANAVTASEIAALTITSNEIAANTITSGQIATGTITADKLQAGSITGNEIAANTITSNQLTTGAFVTTSANITNGVITNAKIGAAAVDTLQLAGQAVTIPSHVHTSAFTGSLPNGAWSTVQTLNHQSSGEKAMVLFTLKKNISYVQQYRVRANGVTIYTGSFTGSSDDNGLTTTTFTQRGYTGVAGNVTYTLEVYVNGGSLGKAGERGIFVLETKR